MTKIFRSHKLVGLVFLALLASGVWLTFAIFTKKFADYEEVELKASSVGLQMPSRADVKIRGVQVGEVLDFNARGEGATLNLGIYPDKADTIPKNVTARIEPKTLFGEKYVALQVPEDPAPDHIEAGDTITQTEMATEVEETLNDLYPLLRTVQPAQLNRTLTAMATALEGRGELIGENLETLDTYLKRMNPLLPALVEDLKLLGQTSELYADVVPEIATTLRNSVTTGNTLVSQEQKLNRLFTDVAAFSGTTRTFLDQNERNLVRVNELGAEQLRLFAKYSPAFPCFIGGIVNAIPRQAQTFRGFMLHINLEMLPKQPRAYGANDVPRYGAQNGPYCGALPNPPYNQQNVAPFPINADDGVDEPTGKGTTRVAPGFGGTSAVAGTPGEADLVRALLAGATGRSTSEVSDLSVLLFAPLVRGTEVTLR